MRNGPSAPTEVRRALVGEPTLWWGNPPSAWFWVFGGAIAGVVLVYLVLRMVHRLLLPRAAASPSSALRGLAAGVAAIRVRYLVPISLAIAVDFLVLPSRLHWWLRLATFALVALQLTLCLNRLIVTAVRHAAAPPPGKPAPVMLGIVVWSLQLVVWLTFLLSVLAAGGVNITAFVASLGVGGIAVALALQNVLGDLFASVSIGLDKPFEPGEYIAFEGSEGTVTRIGIKSTRITSLSGEELAISNSKLLEKLTHNYSRMQERRVAITFAVSFDANREQLRQITERVSGIIAAQESVRFDRGHFVGFGDAGFSFEFVYYVLSANFTEHRDVQQVIFDEIVGVLEEVGVTFAVPARAVTITGRD